MWLYYCSLVLVASGHVAVLLSYPGFAELLGRLALRFTPPRATLASHAGSAPSPVRSLQQLLVQLELSGGRDKLRAAVRGSVAVPAFRGIGKLLDATRLGAVVG